MAIVRARGTGRRNRSDPRLEDIGALIPNKKRKKKSKASRRRKRAAKRATPKPLSSNKYHEYIGSAVWKNVRKLALKYHGARCNRCGSEYDLRVHHLTYCRLGREKMRDLEVLCNDCHCIEHEDKHPLQDSLSREFAAIIGPA